MFGSTAYMSIPPQFRRKFDPKSRKLLLVGYDGYSSNYRLWDAERRRIEISCNVSFNENQVVNMKKENVTLEFRILGNTNSDEEGQEVEENKSEGSEISESEEIFSDANDENFEYEHIEVNNNNTERQLRDKSKLRRPDCYSPSANYCTIFEPTSYENAIK